MARPFVETLQDLIVAVLTTMHVCGGYFSSLIEILKFSPLKRRRTQTLSSDWQLHPPPVEEGSHHEP
jgi:hypothetical protein